MNQNLLRLQKYNKFPTYAIVRYEKMKKKETSEEISLSY